MAQPTNNPSHNQSETREVGRQLTELLNSIKRTQAEQDRTAAKLNKTFEALSDTASRGLLDSLKEAARVQGILTAKELATIKSHENFTEVLKLREKEIEKYNELTLKRNKQQIQ